MYKYNVQYIMILYIVYIKLIVLTCCDWLVEVPCMKLCKHSYDVSTLLSFIL